MLGGKTLAIGLIVLLLLSVFKRFAVIVLAILLFLWIVRLLADMYHHFKGNDKDDFW